MFLIIGIVTLALLTATLMMLWTHERIAHKKVAPHASVEEYWNGDERRSNIRFNKSLQVEYRVEKGPRLKNGRSINLSSGGVRLLLDEKLPKGAILNMKLRIPEKNQTIEAEAQIVWTKDVEEKDPSAKRFFNSGLKFIVIKEPSQAYFSQYLAHLGTEGS